MTVNELIAELQVLVAQGHGELDVGIYDNEYDEYDIILSIEKLSGIKKVDRYLLNPLSSKADSPFVAIH